MLTVIVPAYNEEAAIPLCARRVAEVLDREASPFELLFVDDGSRDGTWRAISALCTESRRIRGLRFSRNFGKEAAMFAGLEKAAGDCCAVMDCDMQHPPEKLPEMYRLWEQGVQVVEGVKEDRGTETPLHRFAARRFYGILSGATGFDLQDASDFKLLDRQVVDALNAMPERSVFFRALSHWVGFRRAAVSYRVEERSAGQSKWSAGALVSYALRNIASFSAAPMQVVTWVGAFFLLFSVILGIQTLVRLLTGNAAEGFTTVILVQLFSASLVLLSLGIIGFYIARIYEELKGRPRYIIAEERNASAAKDSAS